MIIVPGRFIYLFTPRTASRATERAFLEHVPEALISNKHHDHPRDIPNIGLPVYATIRDPYEQALSWYWVYRNRYSVSQWVHKSPPGRRWIQKRMNEYDEYVDAYFVYEDGIERIFKTLALPGVKVGKVGVSGTDKSLLDEEARAAIDDVLEYDVKLYKRICGARDRLTQ